MKQSRPCYVCDGMLSEKRGTFKCKTYDGTLLVVDDAVWLECELCHDQVLPAELNQKITRLERQRIKK